MADHIHPIFDQMLSRQAREVYLGQRGRVLWFTGLSGSGKSSIAIGLERALFSAGHVAQLLDGDNIRSGLNANLGFGADDRMENVRRVAEVAKLYANSGLVVLCAFISPTAASRELARSIIGPEDYLEIFVDTPLAICEARDVKGLYAKARRGEIPDFTGISSPYEAPTQPFLHLLTAERSLTECVQETFHLLLPHIQTLPAN